MIRKYSNYVLLIAFMARSIAMVNALSPVLHISDYTDAQGVAESYQQMVAENHARHMKWLEVCLASFSVAAVIIFYKTRLFIKEHIKNDG